MCKPRVAQPEGSREQAGRAGASAAYCRPGGPLPQRGRESAGNCRASPGSEGSCWGPGRRSEGRARRDDGAGALRPSARESGADRPARARARFPGPGVWGRAAGGGWGALRRGSGAPRALRGRAVAAGESGSGGFREAPREPAPLWGKGGRGAGAGGGHRGALGQAGRCPGALSWRARGGARPVGRGPAVAAATCPAGRACSAGAAGGVAGGVVALQVAGPAARGGGNRPLRPRRAGGVRDQLPRG